MTRERRGGHEDISGQRVEWYSSEDAAVDRSVLGALDSRYAQVERSVISRLHAEDADIASAAIGMVAVERGTIQESTAGVIAGRSIACDEVRTIFLAAPVVRGEVHTWFDMRSAIAVGVGIALGRALLAGVGAALRTGRH